MSILKTRYQSRAEKQRKKQEATVILNDKIKSTHTLFQLGFTHATEKDQATASDFSSDGSNVTTVLLSEPAAVQAIESQETAKNNQDVQCHVMDAERQIPEPEPEFQNDVGLWRIITNAVQEYWCSRDALECQHFDNGFSASLRQYDDGTTRHFTHFMTFRNHVNGEKIKREWLMYSPSSGNVYCFPCVLLRRDAHKGNPAQFCDGFSDGKNAAHRMQIHENSAKQAFISRRQASCRLDCSLQNQFDQEKGYWKKTFGASSVCCQVSVVAQISLSG